MRKIEATIDPRIFPDVREALARVGVTDFALGDVRCTDAHGAHVEFYRGVEYRVDLVPKLRLEVVIDHWSVDLVVKAITTATEMPDGVGRVLVVPVEQVTSGEGETVHAAR
jgi:nitrogen regulatory protein P-II 1